MKDIFKKFNLNNLNKKDIINIAHYRHEIITFKYLSKKYVIKRNNDLNDKNLFKEYRILNKLRKKYVVQVYKYHEKEKYYIMECMDGNIHNLLKLNLKKNDKINIINKVFDCLIYLEKNKIVHLDFSYHNVFYKKIKNNFIIKLGDFEFFCKQHNKINKNDIKPYMSFLYEEGKIDLNNVLCIDMLYQGITEFIKKINIFNNEVFISFEKKCQNKEFKSIKEAKKYFNFLLLNNI